jgi:hypothetical protein
MKKKKEPSLPKSLVGVKAIFDAHVNAAADRLREHGSTSLGVSGNHVVIFSLAYLERLVEQTRASKEQEAVIVIDCKGQKPQLP